MDSYRGSGGRDRDRDRDDRREPRNSGRDDRREPRDREPGGDRRDRDQEKNRDRPRKGGFKYKEKRPDVEHDDRSGGRRERGLERGYRNRSPRRDTGRDRDGGKPGPAKKAAPAPATYSGEEMIGMSPSPTQLAPYWGDTLPQGKKLTSKQW